MKTERFFICYLPTFLKTLTNCSPIACKILSYILVKAFNGNLPMTSGFREECINALEISQAHYYKGLSDLLKSTFTDDEGQTYHFIVKEKGNIIINPLLSWRGNTIARQQALNNMGKFVSKNKLS